MGPMRVKGIAEKVMAKYQQLIRYNRNPFKFEAAAFGWNELHLSIFAIQEVQHAQTSAPNKVDVLLDSSILNISLCEGLCHEPCAGQADKALRASKASETQHSRSHLCDQF
mmetsp:Transcript_93268/g.241425  ORF Transcript_93268/g.241425 Transcript_93268/m.241425 type:complete len:111 (+) Transcript_93268:328-660(+)